MVCRTRDRLQLHKAQTYLQCFISAFSDPAAGAWSLETGMFNKQMALQTGKNAPDRMAAAVDYLAVAPTLSLSHRDDNLQTTPNQTTPAPFPNTRRLPRQPRPKPLHQALQMWCKPLIPNHW
jgi:hypothetical protein